MTFKNVIRLRGKHRVHPCSEYPGYAWGWVKIGNSWFRRKKSVNFGNEL